MDDSDLSLESECAEMPMILAIALKISQLCFPDLIYTGKIESSTDSIDDCALSLFARNERGEFFPSQTISLEIIKVGNQRSLTAEYLNQEQMPILWYGQHAIWMDGNNGKTVLAPNSGLGLERLARGILKKLDELH